MKKATKWLALVAGATMVMGAAIGMSACGGNPDEDKSPMGLRLQPKSRRVRRSAEFRFSSLQKRQGGIHPISRPVSSI